ncbi:M48 family metalloprotease [Ideonella sp. 4Y16]|uniref:M48 family metalloprotease n=1 Tax=Ideonella alba TaxID=2824118 RepID=UPI001B385453|nr:M48 family metalloprotease [Ideonella alba]MBQ0943508.1 M48 family metalloprotease [Ideonella alba]
MSFTSLLPWRRSALALALALLAAPAPTVLAQSAQRLPALGDSASDDVDILQERRLGDNIMRDLRKDPDYLEDLLLQEYLDDLLGPLLAAARERDAIDADLARRFAWEGFLVRDRAVNAFALPGGYLGVYLGLIAITATRDELASVLAHELTHVTQRHIARSIGQNSRQSMATMAGMLLGVLAAAKSRSPDGLQAVIVGSQAIAAQGQLNFSRDMEREADRIGLDLMGAAGFGLGGMSAMFEKLDAASRLNDAGLYPYLRSHPLTSERITEARLRAEGLTRGPAAGQARHALMQARARALSDPGEASLRRVQAAGALGSPAADLARQAQLYGAALASSRLRDFTLADQQAAAGLSLVADSQPDAPVLRRLWRLLRLEILLARASGEAPSADLAARLHQASDALGTDASRAALLLRAQTAQTLARLGEPGADTGLRASTEALQAWVVEHRRDAPAWDALAASAQPLGQQVRALGALAEARWARGDVTGAVDRFRAAQQAARSTGAQGYQDAAIIESRLREAEAERRRLWIEQHGERVPDPG